MKTGEINDILFRGVTGKFYRGTFPADENFEFKVPYCIVTNCDSHNGPGSHWNAWFVTKSVIYFFDSYGRSPKDLSLPNSYSLFVKNKKILYNHKIVEGIFSKTCGQFCIYVLYYLCSNVAWRDIIDSFVTNTEINEKNVCKLVRKLKKL